MHNSHMIKKKKEKKKGLLFQTGSPDTQYKDTRLIDRVKTEKAENTNFSMIFIIVKTENARFDLDGFA